ncbi:hypothetical protein RFI_31773, partial [Reticulomyxa filosa]
YDKSVRLWDIRSSEQIQVFNGHTDYVTCVEYSPFVIKNNIDNSNVICSGSMDNTIRFWDIRSNKNELYMINADEEDDGIACLKFIVLKKKNKTKNVKHDLNLSHSYLGIIYFFIEQEMKLFFGLILNLFDLIEMQPLKDVFYLTCCLNIQKIAFNKNLKIMNIYLKLFQQEVILRKTKTIKKCICNNFYQDNGNMLMASDEKQYENMNEALITRENCLKQFLITAKVKTTQKINKLSYVKTISS